MQNLKLFMIMFLSALTCDVMGQLSFDVAVGTAQTLNIDYDNDSQSWMDQCIITVTSTTDLNSPGKYVLDRTSGQVKTKDASKQKITFNITDDLIAALDFNNLPGSVVYNLLDNGGATVLAITVIISDISQKTGKSRPVTDALEAFIDENYSNLSYNNRRNLLLEGNIIHVFLDQDGNYIRSSLPTTAKEENTFQFHVLYWDDLDFNLTVNGSFKPTFNVLNTSESNSVSGVPTEIHEKKFGAAGPFTNAVKIEIRKSGDTEPILKTSIPIAKLFHVSISTGLFGTTLRNPQNIEKVPFIDSDGMISATDSTLISDDPNARGVFTVMATYYPKGRSFLFPPSGGLLDPSRIGILIGAQVDDSFDENFFSGFSVDFARGGSFAAGIHFGRRNYIAGGEHENFNFGSDIHTGTLQVKKEWDLGIFFGAVIDTRVAGQLFNRIGNN